MATRMQQRRGTTAQWASTNPILAAGEIGFESDSGKFKIGDGVNHWADLTYFASASEIMNIVDGAPDLLNTLNELAAAVGDDPAFFTTVATNLSNHETDTTNVHGIADTSALATKSYADGKASDAQTAAITAASSALSAHESDTTNIHGIADTSALATKTYADGKASDAQSAAETTAASALATHSSDTSNVHGIADTTSLATKTYADDAVSTHSSDTTNVHGIADTAELATKTYVGSAISAIDFSGKQDVVSGVSSTEIGYLDGVTSAIQTQLNNKQDALTVIDGGVIA